MLKTLLRHFVFTAGLMFLVLLTGNCGLFRDTGVCTRYDSSIGDYVCFDEVTEKECEELGGDFFIGEPCY